jgi:hypothetical protein
MPLPAVKDFPTAIYKQNPLDLFEPLFEERVLIGTPSEYKINYKKLKFNVKFADSSAENHGESPLTVKDLIDTFRKHHKKARKSRAKNSSKEIQQMRFLVRKFDVQNILPLIPAFFLDKNVVEKEGSVSVDYFFNWAKKKLTK